ncbi:unnamed protein product [Closterium sp. NIES-54]
MLTPPLSLLPPAHIKQDSYTSPASSRVCHQTCLPSFALTPSSLIPHSPAHTKQDSSTSPATTCVCPPGFLGNGHHCKDMLWCPGLLTFPLPPISSSLHPSAHTKQDSSTSPATTCVCPPGFLGNGHHCKDINECAPSHPACKCPDCKCRNTFGSYECTCVGEDMVYIDQLQACISRVSEGSAPTRTIWGGVVAIVLGFIAVFAVLGYLMYQYHLRTHVDSEIRAIMAQYMPLDESDELPTDMIGESLVRMQQSNN